MHEFACEVCASPAVVYPDDLDANAPVVCAGCGAEICTYGEFRQQGLRSCRGNNVS
jgi:hypothetical protein